MSKSLADLRTKPVSRPERAYTVCLSQNLVAEVSSLTDELAALDVSAHSGDDDSPKRAPRRLGEGEPPRATEIKARLSELLDEMAEHEGELRVRAIDDGDWRRWVNAHPGREKDEPGHKRDLDVTGGFCSADDLIDDLATFAYSWNGEPLQDGDWDILAASISGADKKQLGRLVVGMHESGVGIPKWRSALSDSLRNERASNSPGPSESRTSDSTDGSPESSTEATTATETKSP